MRLSGEDFKRFGFNRDSVELLQIIQSGIRGVFGDGLVLPSKSDMNDVIRTKSEFKNLAADTYKKILDAEYTANTTGSGLLYGQLVVLGYSEYRIAGNRFEPIGGNNNKYRLKRRKTPSGYKPSRVYISGDENRVCEVRGNSNGSVGSSFRSKDPLYTISRSGSSIAGSTAASGIWPIQLT